MSLSCECCVFSGRGLCDGLSFVQRSPTEGRFVCVCVCLTDLIKGHNSLYTPAVIRKKKRKKDRQKERTKERKKERKKD